MNSTTTNRSPWPTYLAALLLGMLLALLLLAPAHAGDAFRLDRVAIVRFTPLGTDKLQRHNGVLLLDGSIQWKFASEMARPGDVQEYELNRTLITKEAWLAYYNLGAFALEGFELLENSESMVVGGEYHYAIAANPTTAPFNGPLMNISTRTTLTSPDDTVIAGFVIGERSRSVLIRAVGPGLNRFDVPNPAPDTKIEILRDGQKLYENDDWSSNPGADLVARISARVGAFPLDQGSRDAARIVTLPPGVYTVHATTPASGAVLVEVYSLPNDLFYDI